MENINGLTKILVGGIVSIFVAGIITHVAVANKHVTRSEASVMIEKESPYIKDRSLILDKLETLGVAQSKMSDTMQRLLENSRSSK